jgi:hypothetical protein
MGKERVKLVPAPVVFIFSARFTQKIEVETMAKIAVKIRTKTAKIFLFSFEKKGVKTTYLHHSEQG